MLVLQKMDGILEERGRVGCCFNASTKEEQLFGLPFKKVGKRPSLSKSSCNIWVGSSVVRFFDREHIDSQTILFAKFFQSVAPVICGALVLR